MNDLPAIVHHIANELAAADPRWNVEALHTAAECLAACEWIAAQPTIGPAATWWDLRARARVALGLPPVADACAS